MKKIVVMPVKNEDWILEKTLFCISLWADYIIIADQNSTDRTAEIISKFSKVILIKNESKIHTSSVRKQLLEEARKIEGSNLIFSFDADEIPTSDIVSLSEEFVSKLKPGDAIELQWLNLWRSPMEYRDDDSVWSNSWKVFGFVDDRIMNYEQVGMVNDHTARVPMSALKNIKRFENPKVLHYQFADWLRTNSKQSRYRLTEFIIDHGFINILKINHRYFPTKIEKGIKLKKIENSWLDAYQGADLKVLESSSLNWFDLEILSFFKKYDVKYFKWLDIWDVNWEVKRKLALEQSLEDVPVLPIKDPRNIFIKFYHFKLQRLLLNDSILYKIYKKIC